MDARQRRQKRKAKDQARRRATAIRRSAFDAEPRGMRTVLLRAYRDARREYPCLLNVVEIPADPLRSVSDEHLIRDHVGNGFQQIRFTMTNDAGHAGGGQDLGGVTMFFHDRRHEKKACVFIRSSKTVTPDEMAVANLAIFFHELGHVDDFSKGLYLVPGRTLDVVKAELHAHLFACKRLRAGGFRTSLSLWLAALEMDLARCGVPNVEQAAQLTIDSQDYRAWRAWAGPLDRWNAMFSSARPPAAET